MTAHQTPAPLTRQERQRHAPRRTPPALPHSAQQPGPATVAWIYIRHELLTLAWALMDVAVIAPVALIVLPWIRFWPLPAFTAWLLIVLLIPFNLSRFMSLADVDTARQRRVMLVAFLLLFFLSLRTLIYEPQSLLDLSWLGAFAGRLARFSATLWRRDLVFLALVALLWQRGLALARRPVAVTEVGFRLRLGALVLAPILVILGLVPAVHGALSFVMLFFLAALLAVALSRAEEVTRQETGATYPMSPRWALTVFLTSFFIVAVAALFGLALSGQGWRQLLLWLAPVGDAVSLGGMVIVTTVTFLLLFLATPLQWLLRQIIGLLGGLGVQNLPEPGELAPQLTDQSIDQLLLEFNNSQGQFLLWLNRAAIVIFVLLILVILYVAYRRFAFRRALTFDTEGAGAPGTEMPTTEIGLGQRLINRLRRLRRWRAAATVRQTYRAMCAEAAEQGFPRALSETPFEYLPTLLESWPAVADDIHLITGAYVRVRYGQVPESEEELHSIHSAWRRIQKQSSARDATPGARDTP